MSIFAIIYVYLLDTLIIFVLAFSFLYLLFFFFFNDTATTEIYTLSLHDALPISPSSPPSRCCGRTCCSARRGTAGPDRKSTRLNSSHANISYAVFCLKKKKKTTYHIPQLSIRANRRCLSEAASRRTSTERRTRPR